MLNNEHSCVCVYASSIRVCCSSHDEEHLCSIWVVLLTIITNVLNQFDSFSCDFNYFVHAKCMLVRCQYMSDMSKNQKKS